jgi:carboxyl-terminal processing protease
VIAKFAEAMKEFRDADGIILDLRGNPGGLGGMAIALGGFLVTQPDQKLGTMQMRAAPFNFVLHPRAGAYAGPLAVLVDELSMSTSEVLAGGLQDLKRARVFGTATPGAALPSVVERLPNGDGFQYVVANYVSVGGKTLEGHGVVPDQIVPLDRQALLDGRDPVIEAAVKWIESQKRK